MIALFEYRGPDSGEADQSSCRAQSVERPPIIGDRFFRPTIVIPSSSYFRDPSPAPNLGYRSKGSRLNSRII